MEPNLSEQKKPQAQDQLVQKQKRLLKFLAYEMATEFAFMIALPIISLVYLGKWLDTRHNTKVFIFIGFFLALAISTTMIGIRINRIRKGLK
jgi:hypothetical protein